MHLLFIQWYIDFIVILSGYFKNIVFYVLKSRYTLKFFLLVTESLHGMHTYFLNSNTDYFLFASFFPYLVTVTFLQCAWKIFFTPLFQLENWFWSFQNLYRKILFSKKMTCIKTTMWLFLYYFFKLTNGPMSVKFLRMGQNENSRWIFNYSKIGVFYNLSLSAVLTTIGIFYFYESYFVEKRYELKTISWTYFNLLMMIFCMDLVLLRFIIKPKKISSLSIKFDRRIHGFWSSHQRKVSHRSFNAPDLFSQITLFLLVIYIFYIAYRNWNADFS